VGNANAHWRTWLQAAKRNSRSLFLPVGFDALGGENMNSMIYKNKKPLLVFLIPAFAIMLIYLYYPFAMNVYNSICDIKGLGRAATGMNTPWYANIVELFRDPKMKIALINTMKLMGCTIVFQVGIALVLALLIDNIRIGKNFFRIAYFFPIIISATALGLLFNLIFLYDGGMLNNFLALFTKEEVLIDWKDKSRWMITMFVPIMWQYVGFYFVVLITGLNNISSELYEAAAIDGANGFKCIRYIKLPLLHNVLCTCLVLAITGSLKVFDLPWTMMPTGMPLDQSWLTGTYMYHVTFNASNVDYGSTIAIVIVLLGIVISQIVNTVFKEKDY
jgi:raffinose/stachyose/melibiose transport system permease protein